jgi:hypothetical protein
MNSRNLRAVEALPEGSGPRLSVKMQGKKEGFFF